jgi:hypothetical protein
MAQYVWLLYVPHEPPPALKSCIALLPFLWSMLPCYAYSSAATSREKHSPSSKKTGDILRETACKVYQSVASWSQSTSGCAKYCSLLSQLTIMAPHGDILPLEVNKPYDRAKDKQGAHDSVPSWVHAFLVTISQPCIWLQITFLHVTLPPSSTQSSLLLSHRWLTVGTILQYRDSTIRYCIHAEQYLPAPETYITARDIIAREPQYHP